MNHSLPTPPGFWRTVLLLLGATRKKAAGRRKRQRELLQQRAGRSGFDWGKLGFAFAVLFMFLLNGIAAFVVSTTVKAAQRLEAERHGKIVVSDWFLTSVYYPSEGPRYQSESRRIADTYGGDPEAIEEKLRDAVRNHGSRDFITRGEAEVGLKGLASGARIPAMMGSLVLLWWAVMLVFQGEGLELDLQRRRHPIWEWLFAHPVRPGAVFLAEMLSPIAANPVYWGAPLFTGLLYLSVYGAEQGLIASFLIGVPIAVAAACLGKALEIGTILRFSLRTRGAVTGIMSWLGYASMMLFFFGAFAMPKVVAALGRFVGPFVIVPWPWLRWYLGGRPDGSFSFVSGLLYCWLVAGVTIAGAIWFSVWGTQQGLSGKFAAADAGPARAKTGPTGPSRFGKDPLYRKEFLWFVRDRSAVVQAILIPLTVAGFQLFNLRGLLVRAQGSWNYLSGAAILFGTYFLWVLGPKSLASEGTALWIPMTWPRGLESLLKAKAWLWARISSVIVALVLCYAAFLFPIEIWKIALVGVGWFFFASSMAEKSVTLVTVASSSGEQQKIPWGRRAAAQLGMLTFAIGILTQQWILAVVGIVYSYLTAAAMWQNFRARLPYLYDPWSEKLPPAPTLMHAMVAISILVEGGAIFSGLFLLAFGRENAGIALAFSYGLSSLLVSIGVWHFLDVRNVSLRDVWRWNDEPGPSAQGAKPELQLFGAAVPEAGAVSSPWWRGDPRRHGRLLGLLLLGACGGVLLGLFAHGYQFVLQHIPATAEFLRNSRAEAAKIPNLRLWFGIMAVGFAPFTEEYLFRGLLFRALDREWGGWRAVAGSAAFFAIYHPAMSWLPVGLLGACNAMLFKKTGRLAPAVVLHMIYNAVVLLR